MTGDFLPNDKRLTRLNSFRELEVIGIGYWHISAMQLNQLTEDEQIFSGGRMHFQIANQIDHILLAHARVDQFHCRQL